MRPTVLSRWMSAAALLAAIASSPALAADAPLRVASLHTVATELVQRVGGDRVAVSGLVKPDTDPHDYEPTPADLKVIAASDLIVAAGRGMESYLPKLKESAGTKAPLLKVGNALPPMKKEKGAKDDHDHAHGKDDPHWWNGLAEVQRAAGVVRDQLAKLRPADREFFAQNAAAYVAEIDELRKWAAGEIAKIPRDQRRLATSHHAFAYFARDWDFRVLPVKGFSTTDEPGSRRVAEVIAQIKKLKVKTVFPENLENPKVLEEITRETGAAIGGRLYSDGLGSGDAGTYAGMYRSNVNVLVTALAPKP